MSVHKSPNVKQHFNGGTALDEAVSTLSVMANAFDVTGNTIMADRLDDIASKIHKAHRKMQRAFVAEIQKIDVEPEDEGELDERR